jgi:hypothetical protein
MPAADSTSVALSALVIFIFFARVVVDGHKIYNFVTQLNLDAPLGEVPSALVHWQSLQKSRTDDLWLTCRCWVHV